MKWRRGGSTQDVIDVRGGGGGRRGGGAALPVGGGLGLVGVVVFLAIQLLGGGGGGTGFDVPAAFDPSAQAPTGGQPIPADRDPDRDLKDFSIYVFNNVQGMWSRTFAGAGQSYERAKLVLYRGQVGTGCGGATSAVGPFYCPADRRVYLDLSFYRDMERQLRAGGDFAWAYVIAHELGHHVQNLVGTNAQVAQVRRDDPGRANEASVRLELQADCYAGVWGQSVFKAGDLVAGDLDEAFTASEAVGDDRLQQQAGRRVDIDSFTHGSSAQRRSWFERGYRRGEPADCDTFAAERL